MKNLLLLSLLVLNCVTATSQIINIPDPVFKAQLLTYGNVHDGPVTVHSANVINIDSNGDGEIQVSEAQNVYGITINDDAILDITGIELFPNLNTLSIASAGVTSISLDNLLNLREVYLNCPNASVLSLNNVNNLLSLKSYCNLSTFNVSQFPLLNTLILAGNNLTSIDFSSNPLLRYVTLSHSPLSSVIFDNNPDLIELQIGNTLLTEIDLSRASMNMYAHRYDLRNNPNLTYINAKNGLAGMVFFSEVPGEIVKVCVDEGVDYNFTANLYNGNPNVVVSTYCSFFGAGHINEIQGNISMDVDNNGCDPTDPLISNFNFAVTDGTITETISSNQLGQYSVYVLDSQYIMTPNPENPSYWNISPPNVVVNFPAQTSPFTQDFCVTANGTIEDLEIIVLPLEQARPGHDTDYKVVVKNKGNVTSSGSVTLDFEEDFMTLLSTNPNAGNTPSYQLSWSFSNLQPFQMEEYEFTMSLNTPTQSTNPLNGGDILTFTGTVTGTGTDAMPADNVMVFDQTVVNSYDPNDKTCLEGETIDPADVGQYVHYMIRFENTGTASAVNIVVKDEIDLTQFDISTLIPLGGSHDYYTRIREGNVVEFIHEDINLDFNDATNDGYVLFKIKTLNTLVAGDTFDNTAEIFFDFNFPIITNTETVTVMSTASVGESTDSSIKVYPNPAKSFINLSASNSLESVTIMDINGRTLSQTNFTGNSTDQRISLENLSSGIYFVTIQSGLGQKVEKLVVE
ncbi:T9SS type A sorting domain-containing protein [Nonlabens ulvanivorans]|uniref:T9SS type A sorting domain-containing protein n=2 Tax=Nonlabens ulvanivorans TaxID=906888 RepID=UPI003298645F